MSGLEPAAGDTQSRPLGIPEGTRDGKILFISSNGIGLGHLTRQLAVARRLEASTAAFFTMSFSARLAARYGYLTHFTLHHWYTGVEEPEWNRALRDELSLLFRHMGPKAVVFDGTMPYGGLRLALNDHPRIRSAWIRRAMWSELHRSGLGGASAFHIIIEPGELAEELDEGPTAEMRESATRVPPVLLLEPEERLSRAAARRRLGIAEDKTAVAMQLGSSDNFDYGAVRRLVLGALLGRDDVEVLEFGMGLPTHAATAPNHRLLDHYPMHELSPAFDFSISAAGYNAFHEAIIGATPTIFIPNEAEGMDRQLMRASYAEREGAALLLHASADEAAVNAALLRMQDVAEQDRMRSACRALSRPNGAATIARLLERDLPGAPR